jgi:hypothetical protein
MRTMDGKTRFAGAALAAALGLATVSGARADEAPGPKPINLYNGTSLEGWVRRGDPATVWKADGEAIVGASDAQAKAHGFLSTEKEYGDFILDLDFKVDPKSPSTTAAWSTAIRW